MRVEIRGFAALIATSLIVALLTVSCGSGNGQPARSGENANGQGAETPDNAASEEATLLAEGKNAWRPCGTCHCATEPRIPEDEDWVKLNEETTWIEAGKPAPRLRKAVIAYLQHPETLRPELVDQGYKPGEGTQTGKVLVPATAGSAHLKAQPGSTRDGSPSMIRLYWPETEDEKAMTMPSGKYTAVNYCLYRTSRENGQERWMVTGTNVDGCTEVSVDPGEEAYLSLEPVLYSTFTSTRSAKRLILSFGLHDMWGNRVTLSKDGRVVMPRYRILDEEGKTLAEGTFGIIWGSFTADWGPGPENSGRKMRAELVFDTGPFEMEGETAIDLEGE